MKLIQNIVVICLFYTACIRSQQVAYLEPLSDHDKLLKHATRACVTGSTNLILKLPTTQGLQYQVMGLVDNTGDLSWITTITDSNQLQLIYTATSCDRPLTLVLRDTTGSFAATTITLTGNSLINYSPSGDCADSQGFIWAPTLQNTFIGMGVGNSNNLTGTSNVALGFNALMSITGGNNNIAIGAFAQKNLTGSGTFNFTDFPTSQSVYSLGADNIALGVNALATNDNSFGNIAIGTSALADLAFVLDPNNNNTPTVFNTALGYYALNTAQGVANIGVGPFAMGGAGLGSINIAMGPFALYYNLGQANIAIGLQTLFNNSSGFGNTAIGLQSLMNNTDGRSNVAVGLQALMSNTLGLYNSAMGSQALYYNVDGNFNTATGGASLFNVSSTKF